MKNYIKELVIFILQFLTFYIFPLFAKPIGAMGMVFVIIILTFVLSLSIGYLSDKKIKFLYPLATSIIFVPTIYIYYNESATVYSVFYLVISIIGLIIGTVSKKKKLK